MSKITIEIPTSSLDEIIALTKKLHGAVIDIEQQSTTSPLKYLKNISQNGGITWRADGKGFYFSSTKRNGGDRDIYYMDPKNPSAAKMVLQVKGGGWGILDISKDNSQLLIGEYISANESHIWSLDIASGKLSEVTDRASKGVIQSGAKFGNSTNEIWFLTDKDNEFERLAILDVKTKKVNYLTSKINWNVENFSFSEDKKQLVFITNEAGRNKMRAPSYSE